jgi:hypothetical protein
MTRAKSPWLLRGGVIGLALLVGLIAWLRTDDNKEPTGNATGTAAAETLPSRIVSPAELLAAAAESGHPVYWAGPVAGDELELVEVAEGGTQVRYVPEGTAPEEAPSAVLTVGSYPLDDPQEALENIARQPGAAVHHARDGTEVVVSGSSPTSAYFADPENSVQVEVYDPSASRALSLALSGRVRPVG